MRPIVQSFERMLGKTGAMGCRNPQNTLYWQLITTGKLWEREVQDGTAIQKRIATNETIWHAMQSFWRLSGGIAPCCLPSRECNLTPSNLRWDSDGVRGRV